MNLTEKEIIELKKLLADLKSLNVPLKTFLTMHNHDNNTSTYIKDININDAQGSVIKLNTTHIALGKGLKLKTLSAGLPNLAAADMGTIYYNTTYNEVWVWRKNGANYEWKALAYVV